MPKKITLEDVGKLYNDEIIQYNDNTKVLNIPHRNYNQALQRKFQRGAKQNAAWDKDHPVAAKWRNVVTTIPFAVAAAPFATAAINTGKVIRTIPKVAKTINTIAKSPIGKIISKAKPYINGTLALSGIAHGVNEIKNTGFTPQAALDLSLAYPALKNILPKTTYTPIKGYNIENKTNIKGYLPFNENKKPNYGSYIKIPSTGQIIPLTDETIAPRRELIKRINLGFSRRYGYKPIPLKASKTRFDTENAIKSLMEQHNTFVRGVRDERPFRESTNAALIKEGLEPTTENRLQYYATHYAGDTGHGRANKHTGRDIGTLYTSNMPTVGKGYSIPFSSVEQVPGGVYAVRRPLDFSSKNLADWVINNDFKFHGMSNTISGSNYFDYELPYYLKTGKSLRKEFNELNPINKSDIVKKVKDKYYEVDNLYLDNIINNIKSIYPNFKVPIPIIQNTPQSKAVLTALEKTYKQLQSKKFKFDTKIIKDFLSKHKDIKYDIVFDDDAPYVYNLYNNTITSTGSSKSSLEQLKRYNDELQSITKTYFNDDMLNDIMNEELSKISYYSAIHKKALEQEIKKEIQRKYIERSKYDISDYAKSKGLIPTKQRSLLFGDVVDPINRTRFSLQEPQQHFVFEGPVGEKGLNIVRKYSKEELDPLPYTARGHRGAWGQNLSRKVKKYGGIKI